MFLELIPHPVLIGLQEVCNIPFFNLQGRCNNKMTPIGTEFHPEGPRLFVWLNSDWKIFHSFTLSKNQISIYTSINDFLYFLSKHMLRFNNTFLTTQGLS